MWSKEPAIRSKVWPRTSGSFLISGLALISGLSDEEAARIDDKLAADSLAVFASRFSASDANQLH